jgi:glutathione S-transferase
MFELYHNTISTCSQKVRLCFAEKNLEFVDRHIEFRGGGHLTPEYLKLNPNGVVPTLVHNGNAIVDSSVIMEYLDEVSPENSLTPADAVERARMRAWMRYIEEVPTVAVRFPSFNQVFLKYYGQMPKDEFARQVEKRPLRKHFYQKMGQGGFSPKDISDSLERMTQAAQRIDKAVATGGPWILGKQLTLADFCVAPSMDRMDDLGHASLWKDMPAFKDWFERLRSRPSWSKAFYHGARLSESDRYDIDAKSA